MSTIKKLNNFQNSFFDETLEKSDKDIFRSLMNLPVSKITLNL